ncbi:MAG: substrate-binding domain-containing protein [Baekduia sp.]
MSRIRFTLIALLAATGVAAGGCGGGDEKTSDTSSGSDSSGAPAFAVEGAKKSLSDQGTFIEAPTKPVKPAKDKKLMLISCGQAISACQFDTAAAAEAAKELGWKSTIYDTKGDPTNAATGIRQAIAGKYDGIFYYYMDCDYARAALEEAKKADVPVVAAEAFDCNQIEKGAPALFTHMVEYQAGTYVQHARAWGRAIADHAIWKQGGKSEALAFLDDTSRGSRPILEGMKQQYAKCDGCKLHVVEFPFSAFGGKLQSIAAQNLLKYPKVNTTLTTYEAISLEVAPAVRESGRDILQFVGEGGEPGLDLIRQGINGYGNGYPLDWEGWAVVDAFARIFNGEKPEPSGIGVQTFDKDNHMPDSGRYVSPIDYQSMYRKLWGLEQ